MASGNSFRPKGVQGFNLGGGNRPPQPPMQQAIQIDLERLDSFHCIQCGGDTFNPVLQLREVPVVQSPSGRPMVVKIECWMCVGCGAVWKSEQLGRMDAKKREEWRVQREVAHQMRQDEEEED